MTAVDTILPMQRLSWGDSRALCGATAVDVPPLGRS